MFYKKSILQKEVIQEFAEKYFAEFAVALYEKVSAVPADKFALAIVHDARLPSGQDVVTCLLTKESELKRRNCEPSAMGVLGHFTSVDGYMRIQESTFSSVTLPFKSGRQEESFLTVENVSLAEFLSRCPIDEKKFTEARKLVADFNTLVSTKKIKDKFNEEFTVNIIENGDATIGGKLIVDRAIVSDSNNKEIGYLLMKYTTPKIREALSMDGSQDGAIYDYFMDVAGVDYARIDDDHQGRGLASQMYLVMAEHLNKKGIQFRGSGIQTDKAKGLWDHIAKKYPDKVFWKKHPETKPKDKCVFFQTEFLPIKEVKKMTKKKIRKSVV